MKSIISTLKKHTNIVFVGGGTGGHISPIIALNNLIADENISTCWIGGKNSEEQKEAKKHNIKFFDIFVLKLSTTRSTKVALYPFALLRSIFAAKKILKKLKKQDQNIAIFSKGWPGALAIGIAGKMLKIPVYIHESDTIPGRSNMKMWRFADKIFLGFATAKKYFDEKKCIVVGQILDPILEEKNENQKITWKTDKKHILVFCGSQGAKSIFEEIANNCLNIDAEWIIVLGKLNANMRERFSNFENIQIFDWLEKSEQRHIFIKAHLAICRASATSLAELQMFDIQKIMIPLPSAAGNHQYFNALEYVKNGDILLEQKNISHLKTEIEKILK